jgi:hypothetical protein
MQDGLERGWWVWLLGCLVDAWSPLNIELYVLKLGNAALRRNIRIILSRPLIDIGTSLMGHRSRLSFHWRSHGLKVFLASLTMTTVSRSSTRLRVGNSPQRRPGEIGQKREGGLTRSPKAGSLLFFQVDAQVFLTHNRADYCVTRSVRVYPSEVDRMLMPSNT